MSSTRPYASPQRNLADTAVSAEIAWALIGTDHGGGELRSLEREELHELDAQAGIDFVQERPDGQRRTWASRFQWGPVWYGSFSIRYRRPTGRPTEYTKRMTALREDLLMPDYTLQGYLDARPPAGQPLAIATIPTRALYGFLDSAEFQAGYEGWSEARQYRPRGTRLDPEPLPWCGYRTLRDGTEFLFVTWDLLHHVGQPVRVYRFGDQQSTIFDPVAVSL